MVVALPVGLQIRRLVHEGEVFCYDSTQHVTNPTYIHGLRIRVTRGRVNFITSRSDMSRLQ
jgi:hypothetical protein